MLLVLFMAIIRQEIIKEIIQLLIFQQKLKKEILLEFPEIIYEKWFLLLLWCII